MARFSARRRVAVYGLLGLFFGAVAGFLLTFFIVGVVIGQSGSSPFGEMAGVAAIGFGISVGVPAGAFLLGSVGIWWALRTNRASGGSLPDGLNEEDFRSRYGSIGDPRFTDVLSEIRARITERPDDGELKEEKDRTSTEQ